MLFQPDEAKSPNPKKLVENGKLMLGQEGLQGHREQTVSPPKRDNGLIRPETPLSYACPVSGLSEFR